MAKWYEFWKAKEDSGAEDALTKEEAAKPPRAWEFDPGNEHGYIGDVPTEIHPGTAGLSYDVLHSMARTPIIAALLNTRIAQVAEFGVQQSSPYTLGFKVQLRDINQTTTKASKNKAKEIEQIILNAGGKYGPGGFEAFLRMIARDSLVYDQCNFEILRSRAGNVVGFVPVDASTIRRAKMKGQQLMNGRRDPDEKVAYVQRIGEKRVAEFTKDELAWGIRRPRTWIKANGYGYPELEELVRVVTYLLNAETYNAVNFTNGIHASTILALKASMSQQQFRVFKRELTAMMKGPAQAKRLPMVLLDPRAEAGKQELQSVNLSKTNAEMEYSKWINWLVKLACAVYQMDPAELGFVFGNEGQTSSLSDRGPADRVAASKERGLRPLLRSISLWMNRSVIWPIDEDFVLDFKGFDSLTEQQKLEMDVKALKAFKTLNEVRAEHDLPPLDDQTGNLILEPSFVQVYLQQLMQQEGEEEGGQFEEGDENQSFGEGEDQDFGDEEMQMSLKEGGIDGLTQSVAQRVSEGIASGQIKANLKGDKKWVLKSANQKEYKSIIIDV